MFESWLKYKLKDGTTRDFREEKPLQIDYDPSICEKKQKVAEKTPEELEAERLEAQRIFEESCHCLNYFEGILKQHYLGLGRGLDNALAELEKGIPRELAEFGVTESSRAFKGEPTEVRKSLLALALLVTMDSSNETFTDATCLVHVDGVQHKLLIRPTCTFDLNAVIVNALIGVQQKQPGLGPFKHYLPHCSIYSTFNRKLFDRKSVV